MKIRKYKAAIPALMVAIVSIAFAGVAGAQVPFDGKSSAAVDGAIAGAQPIPAVSAKATTATAATWKPVFSDTFDKSAGTGLSSAWHADLGTQYTYAGAPPQWGTWEVETNTADKANVSQDGHGHLAITPRLVNGKWTSARIETVSHAFAAPIGGELKLTASIKLPNAANPIGLWPAFWAMGQDGPQNWPHIGEIDTMESVNGLSQVSHTIHCDKWTDSDPGACNEPNGLSSGLQTCAGCTTGFHRYTAIVDRQVAGSESVAFYVDGVRKYSVSQTQVPAAVWTAAIDHGFFMILNVAVGGSYPDKVCGCDSAAQNPTSGVPMLVDNVGAYTLAGNGSGGGGTTPPPSSSAYTQREAESYSTESGVSVSSVSGASAGKAVTAVNNGWTEYGSVDFGATAGQSFTVRVSSSASAGISGTVQVRLDSPTAPVAGTIEVGPTNGVWQSPRQALTPTTGVHDVYLTYSSGQPASFGDIDTLVFGH